MKYREIRKYILNSIDERFCTAEGIRKFVEPQIKAEIVAADLDAVIYRMRSEGDIVMMNNGGFSAYFTAGKIPTSFFRAGGGKINAVYDNPKVGLPVRIVEPDDTASKIEEIAVIPYFTESELQKIEDLTAKAFTKREIAAELDIDEYLFARRARHDLPTRQAISKGCKRKEEPERPDSIVRAFEAKKNAPTVKQSKTRPRVADVRPFAKVVESEPPPKSNCEEKPDGSCRLRFKRLCACGKPLGARTKECRNCFRRINHPPDYTAQPKKQSAVDRRIRDVVSQTELDAKKLSDILLDIFLASSPDAVKERFAERLCGEMLEASREAAA